MKKININLPEELLERLDAYCKRHFTNRTEVIKRLVLELLMEDEKTIK
jgi:metal-responsive CopG/Arc/MetJ family transcriptional regulator